ncbi:MAG TPA: hypothetical protein VFG24_06800, partial [Nitrosopumilaceae archaeon]|nr:hypothetical protein [Nitrosopumilaceae archaeon]
KLGQKNNATSYYKKVLAVNPSDSAALNKLNLTFNNANKTATTGIQKIDKTLLIAVGVFVAVIIGIIVINLAVKKRGRGSGSKITTKSGSGEADEAPSKKSESDAVDDDEWKGV